MKNFIANLVSTEPFLFVKGALIFLLGPLNLQLAYLLLAVGIDLVFGIQVARKEKTFKWSLLFSKVRKKIFIYALWISMFHAFDMIAGLPDTARWAVVVMLAGMELVSAAKNTAKLGHSKLADALEGLYLSLMRSQPTLQNGEQEQVDQQAEANASEEIATTQEGSMSDGKAKAKNQPK
jgi:phage-related holin